MSEHFLKLPFNFDIDKLNSELVHVHPECWVAHQNRAAYEGDWFITSLKSVDGETTQILAVENQEYKETPLLKKCTYIQDVINHFQTKVEAVRFMKLGANSSIKEHRDVGSCYEDGLVRIHIPITSNNKVVFTLDTKETQMQTGHCYYIDADIPHSVVNNGDTDRVHLLIDCHVNDWFKEVFKKAGYLEQKRKYSEKSINDDNVNEIIESLVVMNTKTSLQTAERLKNERDNHVE
ncbi:MAG: aspartyl/asparaginyl beta-hydroxylase domain-containing protein [Sulfurimonas sp.]|nr:aspartyl/asparaginyl beta-hydroxylase domain-containing protein [Sulfurimonas sp.]